jgi:hypothetical protein
VARLIRTVARHHVRADPLLSDLSAPMADCEAGCVSENS